MFRRIVLAVMMVAMIAGGGALLGLPPVSAQATPTATRSFDSSTVDPGGQVVVTITASNYGTAAGVTETLPDGFAYVSSTHDAGQVRELSNNQVRFILRDETSFTYTVTASSTEGDHTFSGTLRDGDRNDHVVGGSAVVTVRQAAGPPPSATRSINPSTVEPGGRVAVRISASNYGQSGSVTETLPAGFTYVSSSLAAGRVNVTGQQARFTLQGETSFTYTVTASSTVGRHTFSGALSDSDGNDHVVGGSTDVTVRQAGSSPASATRSFNRSTVEAGGQVVVTIRASNYGQAGGVTETLPEGFAYVSSSLDDEQVNVTGQRARFTLQGDDSFTYTVTASSTAGTYTFSGTLRDDDRNDVTVRGSTVVRVTAPPPASATRSFSPSTVEPGGQVVVTIRASNYGQAGGVTETLPEGFAYVSSSLDDEQVLVTGQQARFTLQGENSFTYTATVSSTEGDYTFSGILRDSDRNDHTVRGSARLTVGQPAPPPPPPPPSPTDRRGVVTLSDDMPMVGDALTATLADADGGITRTTWQWSRCEDAAGSDCAGIANPNSAGDTLTQTSYTPVEADVDKHLKAMAMYNDANRAARTAEAVTANAVEMATVLSDYDADNSGTIEKSEATAAVLDYLLRGEITKEEAVSVVTAYILQTAV